jgi:lipid-binding SYLF domain-containing protein
VTHALRYFLVALLALFAVSIPYRAGAEDARVEGQKIIRDSTAVLKQYFAEPRLEAVRNLMGAVRAVYIAPALKQGAVIVGGTTGQGILLARHGKQWSDPVFMEAKSVTIGFQAGLAELEFISLIVTDSGVTSILADDAKISSGGGATLGSLGIGGGGSGGVSGGVESISFAFSKGAFFGGNVGTTSLSLLDDMNRSFYGANFSQEAVLGGSGGRLAEAAELRQLLADAVRHSWGE